MAGDAFLSLRELAAGSLTRLPTLVTKTNGMYLFHGTPASGFLLSPLCIALVKHFFPPPFHASPRLFPPGRRYLPAPSSFLRPSFIPFLSSFTPSFPSFALARPSLAVSLRPATFPDRAFCRVALLEPGSFRTREWARPRRVEIERNRRSNERIRLRAY